MPRRLRPENALWQNTNRFAHQTAPGCLSKTYSPLPAKCEVNTNQLESPATPAAREGKREHAARALFQPFAGDGCGLTVSNETVAAQTIIPSSFGGTASPAGCGLTQLLRSRIRFNNTSRFACRAAPRRIQWRTREKRRPPQPSAARWLRPVTVAHATAGFCQYNSVRVPLGTPAKPPLPSILHKQQPDNTK